jgi:hypothetical protein
VADGATEGHFKALLRTINYVLGTEYHGLLLQPQKNNDGFYLEGISDSVYAGDRDTRISAYGYVLYFCGAPIAWKSKAGMCVTLSSTEAEYYATSKIAKEVIFAKNLEIGIQLQYPIFIKYDNVGAIYRANNHCNSQRTKHIDTRRHFVREWVEDDILKIVFKPTLHNSADIFTKNTKEEIFQTYAVIWVKPIPNLFEMCHFTSAKYKDLVLENDQNDWIVVAKRKQKSKQTEKLVTAK